ncbi:TPA: hypothetical protein SMR42_002878 [Pseudomonas putida]|nr:hypothetical protein [Pseudomonas putida]
MPIDRQHYASSLAVLKDARAVTEKARAYLEHWPDLYTLARRTAADYLRRHTGKALDPDRVWWNVFDTAVGAPSFTGWEHSGPPRQSVRFTDLLIQRFDGGFQQAPDVLPLYGGFYTRGTGASQYGAHNEVQLDAQKVMDDLWAMDFAALVRQRSAQFWLEHGRDFALLARVRLLASIETAATEGTLQAIDRRRLRAYLGVRSDAPVSMDDLLKPLDSAAFVVRHYLIAGGGHLLTLTAADGRVVLYCPATHWPPRAFDSRAALVAWVHGQLAAPLAQDWLHALYRVDERSSADERREALQALRERSGPADSPRWPFGSGTLLQSDLFDELQAWAKADLEVNQHLLVTNHDLRKGLWRGYLGAFLKVVGPMAPAAWPLSLLVLAAGVTRLVLDAQALASAHTTQERQGAILSLIADAVVVVFSIIDVGLGARSLTFRAPPHERLAQPSGWMPFEGRADELEDLDDNRILDEPGETEGLLRNVHLDEQGATWIELQNQTLRVRYSPETEGWLAVDDDDPFAFLPTYPVRLAEEGSWQLFDVPQPSGVLTDGMEQLASGFWDVYMRDNLQLSWEMSQTLLETQRATLAMAELPSIEPGAPLQHDELGYECIERDGRRHYTWREGDEYSSQLLRIYSSEMSQVNNLFRHGISGSIGEGDGDTLGYLQRLFDSLEELPSSDAVRLWRGGSNYRLTGGVHYRNGDLNPGDVLVSTDITSFTENPYVLRAFIAPAVTTGEDSIESVFNETSVVYELVGKGMRSGKPIAPMSLQPSESEVVYPPGHFFRIESVRQVRGERYHFVKVRLREVEKPGNEPVHDLRTGLAFDREAYLERVGHEPLVERFFPAAQWATGQ